LHREEDIFNMGELFINSMSLGVLPRLRCTPLGIALCFSRGFAALHSGSVVPLYSAALWCRFTT